MPCNCGNLQYNIPPTPESQPCDDCLVVSSYRLPCDSGPDPCGEAFTIDLTVGNDLTACDCGVPVYSLVSYDTDAFTGVAVSAAGELTGTTLDWYEFNEYPVIKYKVTCPCNILSATGNVYICFANPCPIECHDSCDPCTGLCPEAALNIQIN